MLTWILAPVHTFSSIRASVSFSDIDPKTCQTRSIMFSFDACSEALSYPDLRDVFPIGSNLSFSSCMIGGLGPVTVTIEDEDDSEMIESMLTGLPTVMMSIKDNGDGGLSIRSPNSSSVLPSADFPVLGSIQVVTWLPLSTNKMRPLFGNFCIDHSGGNGGKVLEAAPSTFSLA